MQELLDKAARVALQAGEIILAIKDKTTRQKADGSPITQADVEANAFITQALMQISPYQVCSEEAPLGYEVRKDLEYFWLVDPLDGTKDFAANLSGWSINIALIHRDRAVLGVVYVPVLKELYVGLEGLGAFKIDFEGGLRVGFLAKNGDCGARAAVTYDLVCALARACKAPFLSQKSCREQTEGENSQSLESTFSQSTDSSSKILPRESEKKADSSPTATPRILEEDNQAECEKSTHSLESTFSQSPDCGANAPSPSLRDTAPAESNQINGACEARNLESVQGDWGVKGGIRGDASQVAPLSPLEKTLSQAKLESSNNAQRVDSSMDCHDFARAKSRNDDKKVDSRSEAQSAANSAQDSRSFDKEAQNLSKSIKDSRILELESGLCERAQGRILGVCNRRARDAIRDSSPKAESTNKKNSTTPLACDSVFHSSPLTQAFIAHYGLESIKLGSSLKFCALASGEADIYPRFNGTKEWDTAASQVILEQSGGAVLSIATGKPLRYNKKHFANDYFVAFAANQVGGAIYEDVRSDKLPLALKASYYGLVVWLTGLAGSGKSTIAKELYIRLRDAGLSVVYLDGDELRDVLGAYSYDKQGRISVAKKRADMARLLSRQGIITIVSTISMFDEIYQYNREQLPNYLEVYIACAYEELIRRDQKQLYSKALKGELPNVVGVDIDYDEPSAHLHIDNTTLGAIDEKVGQILAAIQSK